MKTYDAIVIGAGHNGLVTAAYLARAGLRVLALERRTIVGGAASVEEVVPGFKFEAASHEVHLHPAIVRDLDLVRHGLRPASHPGPTIALSPDRRPLALWPDTRRTVEAIGARSKADAARYPQFLAEVAGLADFLKQVHSTVPPRLTSTEAADLFALGRLGIGLRRLGKREVRQTLRVLPMPVADWLDEWFEDNGLKALLAAEAVRGHPRGPLAAGTAYTFLHRAAANGGFPASGGQSVSSVAPALATAAKSFGAEIRVEAEVSRVIVEDGRAAGVALSTGEEFRAGCVVSNADPRRTFLGLVDPMELDPGFVRQVRNIRFRAACAKVNLALDGLPAFEGIGDGPPPGCSLSLCPTIEYLERASDDAKYGEFSSRPYLHLRIPSLDEPELAPPGQHVASVLVQYAPYQLARGTWSERREALGDAVVGALREFAPDLENRLLGRQVLTPLDLEATYGLTRGDIHHGEMGLDQLFFMRPVPGWAQYRTPIEGLYLCGAGTHPGGGVTGLPGRLAARRILGDMRHRT